MWRSTTALLDTTTARTLLDTPAARSVLSRFTNDGVETDDHDDYTELAVPRLGSFEVMNRTIDIAQAALMRHTLAAYPPDLLIEVPRTACRSLEFHRADEVIEIGQELAAAALDALGTVNASDAGPVHVPGSEA
jgi:NTE family protein